MSLIDGARQPRIGDGVALNRHIANAAVYNRSASHDLPVGETFTITRLYTQTVLVRTTRTYRERSGYEWVNRRRTYTIDKTALDYDDSVTTPAARRAARRALGKKPDDTEEMTYIGIDDPRVQWIWEDLATYASRQHWCREYDTLAAAVGIPGRPQDFHVSAQHNGIGVNSVIRARSQAEADERFRLALNPPTPEPETTPSEPETQAA